MQYLTFLSDQKTHHKKVRNIEKKSLVLSEAHLGPVVHLQLTLTNSQQRSIIDRWQGPKYGSSHFVFLNLV